MRTQSGRTRGRLRCAALTAFCALALGVAGARGCELCAIYAENHGGGGGAGGWFTGAAEQWTGFGSLQLNGREVANTAGQSIESSTTQFILGYQFNDHFSLQANIPYIHRSFRRPSGNSGAGIETGEESGLGDAVLVGKLLLLRRDTEKSTFAWSLLGGLKFPTGSTEELRDETRLLSALVNSGGGTHGSTHSATVNGVTTASGIHGFDLALGSGSVDARIGTSAQYRRGRAFFSAAVQYAINTEGDYGYRFANELTWDGGPGYDLISDGKRTLSLGLAVSGAHKGADTYRDQPVDSSGLTVVYLGPKVDYAWKDRLSAHFGVDFPVSIGNRGLQAVPGPRMRAGFTWMLGPGAPEAPFTGKTARPHSLSMDGAAPPIWTPAPETRFYGGVEYLHWWVKDAPLSVPLVSTGPVVSTHHGLLGNPMVTASDTTILYGASFGQAQGGSNRQPFQGFSGSRITFGYALGKERRFAIEASGFSLQEQTAGFEASGDAGGSPVLGIPVYNSVPYQIGPMTVRVGEDSLPFALPDDPARARANGIITGNVRITNSLQLWGAEANGVITLYRTPSWEVSGVVGLRYLDLSERFKLTSQLKGITGPYKGQYGEVTDEFNTRNQFYGGTLGLRGRYATGRFSLDMGARVALGVTEQTEEIVGGFYSFNFTAPFSTGKEGVFAQPSNEGVSSRNRFTIVPEVQIKLGYAITPRCRATIGYDFMYMSSVLRPGDQIDRSLPKGQTFNQADPLVSTVSPTRFNRTTDFFAHGFNFGVEFRF